MKSVSKVLLIDDNPSCNFIMAEFIKLVDTNIEVKDAESVTEAMEVLAEEGQFPDVIYVDINMPLQDGFDFLLEYEQKYLSENPETKLFMLSSSLRPEDQDRALAHKSVTAFVSKNDIDRTLQLTLQASIS